MGMHLTESPDLQPASSSSAAYSLQVCVEKAIFVLDLRIDLDARHNSPEHIGTDGAVLSSCGGTNLVCLVDKEVDEQSCALRILNNINQ